MILFLKFKINIFQYSFEDGNTIHFRDKCIDELDDVIDKKKLINFYKDNENKHFSYRLVFKSQNDLIYYQNSIKNDKRILNIRADMQS